MASNMFLAFATVDGDVPGESVVDGFTNQIELTGWSWGVSQVGAAGSAAGGTTGTANVSDLVLTGVADKSCPVLSQAAGLGTHLGTCTLTVCRSGGDLNPAMTIVTTGGILSNMQLSGSSAGGTYLTTMSFSINFSTIAIEYFPQDATGASGAATTGSIDVAGSSKGG